MYDTGRSIWTTSRLVIAFIGITCVSVIFPLVQFLPPLTIMRGCFLFCVNVSSVTTPSPTRVSMPKIFSTLTSLILSYLVLKRLVFLSRFLGLINTVHKLISCAVDPLMDLCGRKWRVPPIPLTLWDPHHNPGRSIYLTEILLLFSHNSISDSLWHFGCNTQGLSLSLSLRVCLRSCPLNWWSYTAISFSLTHVSSWFVHLLRMRVFSSESVLCSGGQNFGESFESNSGAQLQHQWF